MPLTREQICQQASKKLTAAVPTMSSIKAMIGLDGFVDEIIGVVDKRASASEYTLIKTIDVLGQKIMNAAGQSSNYEMLVKQTKLGGNGPIMANAMAAAGLGVTYVGNLGYPSIHPVFEEFTKRANVISIAEPGTTEALEFEDGKLMCGKHQSLKEVNWATLIAHVPEDLVPARVVPVDLLAFVDGENEQVAETLIVPIRKHQLVAPFDAALHGLFRSRRAVGSLPHHGDGARAVHE